jgi:hypothetical protein
MRRLSLLVILATAACADLLGLPGNVQVVDASADGPARADAGTDASAAPDSAVDSGTDSGAADASDEDAADAS